MNTWKRSLVFAVLVLFLLSLSITPVLANPVPPCPGTGTPGYWKNHPEEWEEFDEWSYVGLPSTTTQDDALELLRMPTSGDKTLTLFKAALAAKLNIAVAGNWGDCWCVDNSFSHAKNWLYENPPGSGVKANSNAWKEAELWYLELDAYNNGELCAPPRD